MIAFPPRLRLLILAIVTLSVISACGGSASGRTVVATPSVRTALPAVIPAQTPSATAQVLPPLPADLSLLTLANKQRALPAGYAPPDLVPIPREFVSSAEMQQLRRPAADALIEMLRAAQSQGLGIKVNSGYRSYDYQLAVFRSEVSTYGCAQALRESAVPGHSEHQLGLAADLTSADVGWGLTDTFAQTPEGRWLAAHAPGYGFVLSYPEGKEQVTGYIYEPWHYRYVTPPVAVAIQASGETPTEYLQALGALSMTNIVTPAAISTPGPADCTRLSP
jgi:D-alanyl-D-alanine carboxypeptidase